VTNAAAERAQAAAASDGNQSMSSQLTGANVFVLFDTSNYMYRGFVFAQDAITDFVRSLQTANKVAFYSYSRDLSRNSVLTADRAQVLRGVRSTVAGDDAALYNCLLMTVEDAARYTGRKVIVVFSNGPDNASLVPPEDVAELAQSTGTIIYMISTREAQLEPISTAVFERMSKATGGKAYFARSWRRKESVRVHPGRLVAPLFAQLLPTDQPQPGLEKHHRQTGGQRPAEIPRAHARRIQGAASACGRHKLSRVGYSAGKKVKGRPKDRPWRQSLDAVAC
jgi:hypothetical protein